MLLSFLSLPFLSLCVDLSLPLIPVLLCLRVEFLTGDIFLVPNVPIPAANAPEC